MLYLASNNLNNHFKMKGHCKLCGQEKELRNSHIIPEFMYQNLYDKSPRRYYSLKIETHDIDKSEKRIEQKGKRKYLLCGECEVHLSKYEKYAAETIYAKNSSSKTYMKTARETYDERNFIYEFEGFSYSNFKIFMLSLLWRQLVSKSFDRTIIEEKIIEQLRLAIYNKDPLDIDDFGCVLQIILYEKGAPASGFILEPYFTGSEDNPILNILIDGYMYSFYLNSKKLTSDEKIPFLNKNGSMMIMGRLLWDDPELSLKVKQAYQFFGNTLS